MKIVSLFLMFCFSFSLIASSASSLEFEKALVEYKETLNVKWDQRDQGFYRKATQDFYLKFEELILDKGLTQQDVLDVVAVKLKDPKSPAMIKLKASIVQSRASDLNFMSLVKDANKGLPGN